MDARGRIVSQDTCDEENCTIESSALNEASDSGSDDGAPHVLWRRWLATILILVACAAAIVFLCQEVQGATTISIASTIERRRGVPIGEDDGGLISDHMHEPRRKRTDKGAAESTDNSGIPAAVVVENSPESRYVSLMAVASDLGVEVGTSRGSIADCGSVCDKSRECGSFVYCTAEGGICHLQSKQIGIDAHTHVESGCATYVRDESGYSSSYSMLHMYGGIARQLAIPCVAVLIGLLLLGFGQGEAIVLAKIVIYFGAQTGMNIYMKSVLSHAIVSKNRRGLPAPFIVTALQQVTAFILFWLFVLCTRFLAPKHQYAPRILTTRNEWFAVVIFSSSFVLNIALNNYSLSLIPISINLILRSCLPLSTLASQYTIGRILGHTKSQDTNRTELCLMFVGVSCALLAVIAKTSSHQSAGESTPHFYLGVCICIVSIMSASLNLALAGILGNTLKLNPLDTTAYMSVPAFLFLLGPIFFMPHPSAWHDAGSLTDWNIFMIVLDLSPHIIGLAFLSGAFALAYNVLTYKIVQTLSATHTAFAGSFNSAATIVIALVVGLESLPDDRFCSCLMVGAILGNISAFTGYNIVKVRSLPAVDADPQILHLAGASQRDLKQDQLYDGCEPKHVEFSSTALPQSPPDSIIECKDISDGSRIQPFLTASQAATREETESLLRSKSRR